MIPKEEAVIKLITSFLFECVSWVFLSTSSPNQIIQIHQQNLHKTIQILKNPKTKIHENKLPVDGIGALAGDNS